MDEGIILLTLWMRIIQPNSQSILIIGTNLVQMYWLKKSLNEKKRWSAQVFIELATYVYMCVCVSVWFSMWVYKAANIGTLNVIYHALRIREYKSLTRIIMVGLAHASCIFSFNSFEDVQFFKYFYQRYRKAYIL